MSFSRLIRYLFDDSARKRRSDALFSTSEASEMVQRLFGYGHSESDVIVDSGRVMVSIPKYYQNGLSSSLEITKDAIHIRGAKSDLAIAAALRLIKEEGSDLEIKGSEEFKLRVWAHAQIAGVRVTNYAPPRALQARANQTLNEIMIVHNMGGYNGRRRPRKLDGDASYVGFAYERPGPFQPSAPHSVPQPR